MDNNLKYSVWISLALQGCSRNVWKRIEHDGSASDFYFNFAGGDASGLEKREADALRAITAEQAQEIIGYCQKRGYSLVCYDDEAYPDSLRSIDKPPILLYCMGDVSALSCEYGLSVVGTRHPSAYSVGFTKTVCTELAQMGFTIISGFALGIDSAAHYSALKADAPTIAVLGCGLEYSYPKENDRFKTAIAQKGLVVTEYMPAAKPDNWKFPQRNRILSALGSGTLVVEAGIRSGSLVTAKIALEQGRDIFCMPPADVFDAAYAGNISLLRDGAIPAFDSSDIAEHYIEDAERILKIRETTKTPRHVKVSESSASAAKTSPPDYSGLSELQLEVVKLLETGSMHADELAVKLQRPVADLFLVLTELELLGIIEAQAGKHYILSGKA